MRRTALLLLVLASLRPESVFAQPAPVLTGIELFPAARAVNDQRGFAIAMDGGWLAIGARLEDPGDVRNAGAVHLFRYDTVMGTWKEKDRLTSEAPQVEGQFGFALSLRGSTLAVGAAGEEKVDVFTEAGGVWTRKASLEAPHEAKQFGRSVSISGTVLAVGAVDPQGETPGIVYLYSGPSWTGLSTVAGDRAQPDERFGQSVALQGSTLAVGAPGADLSKGVVYVFELRRGRWVRSARTAPRSAAIGDQVGFSVAIDGGEMAVGAPTAGEDDSGAAWVLRREGVAWTWIALPGSGGQLGYSVAIDGGRIAAGAPFSEDGTGSVHVFAWTGEEWSHEEISADNAASKDLSGFSVAVSGDRVVFGAILGDFGGSSAGTVSFFLCRSGCLSMGEVAVPPAQEVFGISVAADGDFFAVGARSSEPGVPKGSVTIFRRRGRGWRQEARLDSPDGRLVDEFGASVAVHHDPEAGDLLVVGDPCDCGPPVSPPVSGDGGRVHLFRKRGGLWEPEARLDSPDSEGDNGFGRSVATDGNLIVIGAGTEDAYVFERISEGEYEGVPLAAVIPPGADFGAAVAVQEDTVVVGAPQADIVYVFRGDGWTPFELTGTSGSEFGAAVAIDGDTLAVGAPREDLHSGEQTFEDAGRVSLFTRLGTGWNLSQNLPMLRFAKAGFGSSIALRGGDLVIGAPMLGAPASRGDADMAFLFQDDQEGWRLRGGLEAIPRIPAQDGGLLPPVGDHFGSGVAIGEGFIVVTGPGEAAGDRIAVFELEEP